MRRLEHDNDRSDPLRGHEFREEDFPELQRSATGRIDGEWTRNEVWKKPPVSLETYQGMVGQEIGVSSWHLVDQKRIDAYADVIEDHQFIHVDPVRAKARHRRSARLSRMAF